MQFSQIPASWKRGFDAARSVIGLADGNHPGECMGAALFARSSLLSVGCNIYAKTHPEARNKVYNFSIHAEHACIIKRRHYDASRNLIMYVYRENHLGKPVCSKPCVPCMLIMHEAGVRRARYIDLDGLAKEIKI